MGIGPGIGLPRIFSAIGRFSVFLTDDGFSHVLNGFLTYHGFLTIASSSRIISLDCVFLFSDCLDLCGCVHYNYIKAWCNV
jgi:hypothetical protein